ncbi:hypothetical protein GF352_00755 [archaeon]|nr:hypothetical protein [archaeon]
MYKRVSDVVAVHERFNDFLKSFNNTPFDSITELLVEADTVSSVQRFMLCDELYDDYFELKKCFDYIERVICEGRRVTSDEVLFFYDSFQRFLDEHEGVIIGNHPVRMVHHGYKNVVLIDGFVPEEEEFVMPEWAE